MPFSGESPWNGGELCVPSKWQRRPAKPFYTSPADTQVGKISLGKVKGVVCRVVAANARMLSVSHSDFLTADAADNADKGSQSG